MMIKNITGVLVICLTAAVIGSSLTELPPECNDYFILNDSSRNINHGWEGHCDRDDDWSISPDWQGSNNWYRMMPPAGVVIPETSLEYEHCGTTLPGWINGSHPTDEGEQVDVEVCFSWDTGDGKCDCYWSQNIEITHCISYYVYYLPETQWCNTRYCAADTF